MLESSKIFWSGGSRNKCLSSDIDLIGPTEKRMEEQPRVRGGTTIVLRSLCGPPSTHHTPQAPDFGKASHGILRIR